MKCIFQITTEYGKSMTWQRLAMFKLCCISLGVFTGLLVEEKHRKNAVFWSIFLFLITYIPLMYGLKEMLPSADDLFEEETEE